MALATWEKKNGNMSSQGKLVASFRQAIALRQQQMKKHAPQFL